jgi:hypothetical protein
MIGWILLGFWILNLRVRMAKLGKWNEERSL